MGLGQLSRLVQLEPGPVRSDPDPDPASAIIF